MPVQEKVTCKPSPTGPASDIRTLFCREAGNGNRNPLIETNFNHLLDQIVQEAFDEGRDYEKKLRQRETGPG